MDLFLSQLMRRIGQYGPPSVKADRHKCPTPRSIRAAGMRTSNTVNRYTGFSVVCVDDWKGFGVAGCSLLVEQVHRSFSCVRRYPHVCDSRFFIATRKPDITTDIAPIVLKKPIAKFSSTPP